MHRLFRLISIFTIIVLLSARAAAEPGNRAPVITDIEIRQIGASHTIKGYEIQVDASDPEGYPLTYKFGTSQFGVQVFSQGPKADVQVPKDIEPAMVSVTVTDEWGGEATNLFDVTEQNHSPLLMLHRADDYLLIGNEQAKIDAIATDRDQDTIRFETVIERGGNIASLSKAKSIVGTHTVNLSISPDATGVVRVKTLAEDNDGGQATSAFNINLQKSLVYISPPISTAPNSAYALDFTDDNWLFVTSTADQIFRFNDSGVRQPDLILPITFNIRALTIVGSSANAILYIGHDSQDPIHGGKIYKFDQNGTALPVFQIDQRTQPHYILIMQDGSFVISDHGSGIKRYFPRLARPKQNWGTNGQEIDQYRRPRQISYNPFSKSFYVADKENNRVKRLTEKGEFEGLMAGHPGVLLHPHGVIFDPRNNIVFVADTNNHRILIYTPDGEFIRQWDQPGVFSTPRWFRIGPNGRLYVTSINDNAIHILNYQ